MGRRPASLVLALVRPAKLLDTLGLQIGWTVGVATFGAEHLPEVVVLAVEAPGSVREL